MSNEELDTGEASRLGDGGGKRGDEGGGGDIDVDGKVGDDVGGGGGGDGDGDEVGDGEDGNDEGGNDEDGSGEEKGGSDGVGEDKGENRGFKEGQYGRGRIVEDTVCTPAVVVGGGTGKARTRVRRGEGTFWIDILMSVLVFGRAPRGWRVTASLLEGTGCIVMGRNQRWIASSLEALCQSLTLTQ
jgi:hypothetical protein